jgi:hypothetical protein
MTQALPGPLDWLRLRWALLRLAWQRVPNGDVWQALEHDVPLAYYGQGAERDFVWYLEGESAVQVENIDALCTWLAGCVYVRDPDLFRTRDFWQHPSTFEHIRQGDCEDHALWAWRKLVELGYEAQFIVGRWLTGAGRGHGWHSWIVYTGSDGAPFVLEATQKNVAAMVAPLDRVRAQYVPCFSVDQRLTRRVHAGWSATIIAERAERREDRRAKSAKENSEDPPRELVDG